jgi:nucleoside phosphorylase
MAPPERPRLRGDFDIAVICALEIEADAVEAMFDGFWEDGDSYEKAAGDYNTYTIGWIGRHNVVLAHMPGMGKGASASVATNFRSSFGGIRLGLVIGICGGVPGGVQDGKEMLLGDVVISTGVVQFDYGRQYSNKVVWKNTLEDNLGRPNVEIRAFLQKIKGMRGYKQLKHNSLAYLTTLCESDDFQAWRYPGVSGDILYPSTYRHKHQQAEACSVCARCKSMEDEVCEVALESSCTELECDSKEQVARERLQNIEKTVASGEAKIAQTFEIHFGRIASGDLVMKSGSHRDAIAETEKVVAFEMEGAGVWDNFPTVVMKGVCDYADSHKNKQWQKYAAASAAACMKAFLREWRGIDRAPRDVAAGSKYSDAYRKASRH